MRIETSELLLAMRRVVSGIEIDRDAPHLAAQPLLLPRDYYLGQCQPQTIVLFGANGVLKAAQGRL